MKIEEFKEWLKSMLSTEREDTERTLIVPLMPLVSVALRKEALTDENRDYFVRCMMQIPGITKGLSYLAMSGVPSFHLDEQEALVCQAIGVAYRLWECTPMNIDNEAMREMYVKSDEAGLLPMNTGLNMRGV